MEIQRLTMTPFLTIITPFYNSELYLKDCLDSIRTQEFADFEVLMIDDGSNDRTGCIIDDFSVIDSRFKAIHQQNGGVSSARNAGLKAATGEWICFVDSDDTLKPDALNTLTNLGDNESDIVFAGYEIFNNKPFNIPQPITSVKTNVELALELFAPSDYNYMGYSVAKLFRRSIITDNDIHFDESLFYNEDRLFNLSFLLYARKGMYTTVPVYNYIERAGSAMVAIEGPSFWKFETDLDAFIKMIAIAVKFSSDKLIGLVNRQTYGSYLYNLHFNKKYGHNNSIANRRLNAKIRTALTMKQYYSMEAARRISSFKSSVYNTYIRLAKKS